MDASRLVGNLGRKIPRGGLSIIVDIFAAVLLIPLTVCGIVLLVKTGNNFTLLCVCIYISVYLIAKKRTA